jgi:O-antigen/teichoic acid export membrane protein
LEFPVESVLPSKRITIVGALVAALLAFVIGPLLGWDDASIRLAALFGVTIALDFSGTPKAVLRLFDGFGHLAVVPVVVGARKLAAVLIAAFSNASLPVFLAITGAAIVINHTILLVLAWRLLRRRGYGGALHASGQGIVREHPELWRFVWVTNISSAFGILTKEFDIVLVGAVLGSGAAGLYRVARQFASLLSRPLEARYHAAYPELARLWAKGEVARFRGLMFRGGLGAGALALVIWCSLWFFGGALLELTVVPSFSDALPVMLRYAFALVVGVFAFSLEPAGYSMGLQQGMLIAHVFSALLYLACLPLLLATHGLIGAGVAVLIFQLTWAAAMLVVQRSSPGQRN